MKILLIVHDIETIDTATYKNVKRIVLSKFHDAMVVHNQFSKEKVKEFIGKHEVKNIHVVPHGNYTDIYPQTYTREQALNYFNLDSSKHYLLFFGQIKKTKGLNVLLESMSLSKNSFQLIIAGKLRVKNFETYQEIIDRNKLQNRIVPLLRFITDDEADKLFTLSDVVVLPYQNIYQSGVLLLAMSFGKTVIVSDLEPFKEIIQHEFNGLLFEKNNPRSLAEVVDKAFTQKNNNNLMGRNAKQFVEKNFLWSHIAETFIGILR